LPKSNHSQLQNPSYTSKVSAQEPIAIDDGFVQISEALAGEIMIAPSPPIQPPSPEYD
jgi:hypothetical protein